MKSAHQFPICVVGGGLVGMMAAAKIGSLLQSYNLQLAHIAPDEKIIDQRTTAMLMPSIRLLEDLGLWEELKPHCAPLRTMRLVDGSKRLIRAPLTEFRAIEVDLEAFGYNVPNQLMIETMDRLLSNYPNISRFNNAVEAMEIGTDGNRLTLDDEASIDADLVVAADGRESLLRDQAAISVRQWHYEQTAIVLNFNHTLPHHDVSTEFHTESGPFTQVPLPSLPAHPNRSSLVWVVKPNDAEAILKRSLAQLGTEIERKLQSFLGKCLVEKQPQSFPLSGLTAEKFGKDRTVLVGEAGHVFPPIGAQGFNLGVRDVSQLGDILEDTSFKIDGDRVAQAYSSRRLADVTLRTQGVDLLNRSLLTDFLPIQATRALGLMTLGLVPPLRKFAMKQGMGTHTSG